MPEHNEPEKTWDEYDWERFLQEQDRKTEQYMELLEQYIDNPERDEIIAKAMGWSHLLDEEEDEEWEEDQDDEEEVEGEFEEEDEDDDEEEDGEEDELASFERHPLYQASFSLTIWLDQLYEALGEVQHRPAAVRLATHSAIASAKLAAALSDDDIDEIGMTIAYLKRALRAVTIALEASLIFQREAKLSTARRRQLRTRLFTVRDGIIQLMGEYRSEWRRRFQR